MNMLSLLLTVKAIVFQNNNKICI